MEPHEVRRLISDLDMTETEFGRACGLEGADPSDTVRRWKADPAEAARARTPPPWLKIVAGAVRQVPGFRDWFRARGVTHR